nr:S8 family peptidase [Deinobacterium chartae]
MALALSLAACGTTPQTPQVSQAELAPLYNAQDEDVIPGQYIVALKDGSFLSGGDLGAQAADRVLSTLNLSAQDVQIQNVYGSALQGFSATLKPAALEQLRRDPRVAYIEADRSVQLDPQEGELGSQATQTGATWGLDRVDQRALPLNSSYTYNRTGAGVTAYIVDTGIRTTHAEFGGRARAGYSAINDGRGSNDCNGHGTHVAGTVGGSTYGVAKGVSLVAVRVLNCSGSGSYSGIIAGLDWIGRNKSGPSVANMSLGGGASTSIDNAVQNLINRGVTVAVAAGNETQNACNVSPARAANAITVASSTRTDGLSYFSNYGSCVDIIAPGSSITSAWHTTNTATNTISGTSMATPHVAGAAALYLQGNPGATPATVRNALVNQGTSGVISSTQGTPNVLLYTPAL